MTLHEVRVEGGQAWGGARLADNSLGTGSACGMKVTMSSVRNQCDNDGGEQWESKGFPHVWHEACNTLDGEFVSKSDCSSDILECHKCVMETVVASDPWSKRVVLSEY